MVHSSNPGLVIFVPGFMGSSLRYQGPGPMGNLIDEEIWSEDVTALLSERNLERLIYPTPAPAVVRAGYIIERVTFCGRLFGLEIYSALLAHLRRQCGEVNMPFLEFPYDWRASIRESATRLIRATEEMLARHRPDSVVLVSHSMGGLVCRLAVAASINLRRRLRRLVHIATPLRGSVRAFRTLKVAPVLNPPVDGLIRTLLSVWDIGRAARGKSGLTVKFMDIIRSFPALYELLPPDDVKPLISDTGATYSCVDARVWPPHIQPFVVEARATHERLAQADGLRLPTFVVYSAAFRTDVEYQLRSDQPYHLDVERGVVDVRGDSTVTVDSATHTTPLGSRYCQEQRPNAHVSLCHNDAVLQRLDQYIFAASA